MTPAELLNVLWAYVYEHLFGIHQCALRGKFTVVLIICPYLLFILGGTGSTVVKVAFWLYAQVVAAAKEHGVTLETCLCTHRHFDHSGSASSLLFLFCFVDVNLEVAD